MPADAINLEIVTPGKRLVSEVADEVVLPGSQGYLGVLPGHAPLLTSLGIGQLMYRRDNVKHYIAVSWGFAEVLADRVSVLAEIAERPGEIDRDRAERSRERAMSRLHGGGGEVDFERAQVALEKALTRLQVVVRSGSG